MPSRATGVGNETIEVDAKWVVRLDELDRRVRPVGSHMRQANPSVVTGGSTPNRHERLGIDKGLAFMSAGKRQ